MPVDSLTVLDASQALDVLAKAYESCGEKARADELFQAAAGLELASPELQACWGGPLNGQVGRQAIILDLLNLLQPIAILETGAFRGISVEWFAQHYERPIFSCEKEKLYFLQAQRRLGAFRNVVLRLQDCRPFLQEILESLSTSERILIYLDAHWQHDLPIREELTTVFARHLESVVVIDDFRVPDDPGYGWDDYGSHGSIELSLLEGVMPSDTRLFFPRLRSNEETGAKRGCCIMASGSAHLIDSCHLLRGNTPEYWRKVQEETPKPGCPDQQSRAIQPFPDVENSSYPNVIHTLQRRLHAVSAELSTLNVEKQSLHVEKQSLQRQLESSEADRATHVAAAERLDAQVRNLQAQLESSQRLLTVARAELDHLYGLRGALLHAWNRIIGRSLVYDSSKPRAG